MLCPFLSIVTVTSPLASPRPIATSSVTATATTKTAAAPIAGELILYSPLLYDCVYHFIYLT